MPATTRPLFEQIDSWMQEIESVKTAAAPASSKTAKKTKKAAPAGMGETSHPSEDVDDNTQPEDTGERFSENSEDVKRDIPASVDSTDASSGGDQDDKQYNIGTTQSAVGEDSATEQHYKSDKDDPGTDHPMNADDVGEKYSSMKLRALLKTAEAKGNSILADLANGITAPAATGTLSQKAAAVKKEAAKNPTPAAQAGYDVAAATGAYQADMDKLASEFIAQTIKDADLDADLVGAFLHSYNQSLTKRAEGDDTAGEGEDHSEGDVSGEVIPPDAGGGDPAAAGGMPPDAGGGGGGDVLSALGAGGAGGGGGDPLAGAGGDPAAMGGDPAAAMGGDPGAGAGGGMSQEQALQELAMALQELGINPEELAQMAQGSAAPPGAAPEGAKLASAVKRFKLAGKFQIREAKTAAQKQAREQIKDYIREITGLKQ